MMPTLGLDGLARAHRYLRPTHAAAGSLRPGTGEPGSGSGELVLQLYDAKSGAEMDHSRVDILAYITLRQ